MKELIEEARELCGCSPCRGDGYGRDLKSCVAGTILTELFAREPEVVTKSLVTWEVPTMCENWTSDLGYCGCIAGHSGCCEYYGDTHE